MRVIVLMSTFNGEKYIDAQIRSILDQLPSDGLLMVRDDGSHDGTVARIRAFNDARVQLLLGENIGFARSFFVLMSKVPNDAEIIMLSDQDDVWLPRKLERAWQALKNAAGTPTLYCTRQQLADIHLKPIAFSQSYTRPPSFKNALVENIVTGCTAAFNQETLKLALKIQDPEKIYFHDWWLYLVTAAFGKVIIDNEATLLYRQHGNNTIGRGVGMCQYIEVIRFLRKKSWINIMYNQNEQLRISHGSHLTPPQKLLLERYFNPYKMFSVVRLIFSFKRFRQSLLGEILFRCLLVAEILILRRGLPIDSNPKNYK